MITRRNLLTGMAAFIAAPAIIRVADLMPIKSFAADDVISWGPNIQEVADAAMRVWAKGKHYEWTIDGRDWQYRTIKGPFEIVPLSTNPTT